MIRTFADTETERFYITGKWGIRINEQWRVCFRFEKGEAYDVEIVDYH